ncbi:MAG TPA: hydroxymethylbilane synthase [Edaphocola sp.]|nr:hydroxymethylbilane synthase [Edaphocola sp.]
MKQIIKIGTRDSRLALWQAENVQQLLAEQGIQSELVPVKSEGDLDLVTPLYAMGVEGVFTKALDAYLLSGKIDIAVHSMKDVPTQLAQGIVPAAVLKRASVQDIFIPNPNKPDVRAVNGTDKTPAFHIATGSVRRKAQWLHHFPGTAFENLRGNVQTRLRKLSESDWDGIIMAKAGLERINLLPAQYEDIRWMLPAPAQGAIMVVCREKDKNTLASACRLNDELTDLCARIERDFLKTLLGGCSTPISALAEVKGDKLFFKGNIVSPNGKEKMDIEKVIPVSEATDTGTLAAKELLKNGADTIVKAIRNI